MNSVARFLISSSAAALAITASVALPLAGQSQFIVTGTVTNAASGSPVANAAVTVNSGKRAAVTRGDGTYRVLVDSTRSELRATAVGFAPASRPVTVDRGASTVVNFELTPSAKQIDEVVTIGTRVQQRVATESAAPVDVISAQMLESSGVTETWQQLSRLVPSVFGPHIPLGDNGTRPITLRGLAPHHTLILVNGKRRHPEGVLLAGPSVANKSYTDINSIPASAIDHIEILRDGASAQYGSDAIGGVVNIVLKSGERRDMRTTLGEIFSSDGGRNFRDGRELTAGGTYGVMSPHGAHVTLSGEYRDRDGTNRAYPDLRPQYFAGDARNAQPPRVSSYTGDGSAKSSRLFVDAAAPLNATTEAYAFGGGSNMINVAPDAFFRRPLDPSTVRALFPDGFLPRVESRIGDASAFAGVRGTIAAWRWDLSSGWGGNRYVYHVDHTNNASMGAASPTSFYAGRVAAQQWTTNLDVSREVRLGSVPFTVSGGGEFRLDTYHLGAGDSASWRDGGVRILDGPQKDSVAAAGSQGFIGFRPIDEVSAHRSNVAAYVEGEGRPFQRLLIQSALRAEHYSDFGSTFDAKFAGRMQLVNGLAVRASASSGFRAPSLTEEYFARSNTVYSQVGGVGTFLTTRTFPVSSPEAKLLGATKLRAETSRNRSAGAVLNWASLPVVSVDLYQVNIDHRIGLTGPVSGPSIIQLFASNGMAGIGGGSYFTNNIDTRTRGVDAVATHAVLFDGSRVLRIVGGYNYNRTRVTHVAAAPAPIAAFNAQLFNRTSRGIIEHGQPLQTVSLGLNYTAGRFGMDVQNQRSGPTAQLDRNARAAGGKDQIVRAKWLTDARLLYRLRPRIDVAVSAANLFDMYPDQWFDFDQGVNAKAFSNSGMFRYPGAITSLGQNGRTLYLELAYR